MPESAGEVVRKAILSLAVVLAVVTAIVSGLFGTTWLGKTVQAVMTPLRSGVSAITRQVERYYNYVFGYEALEAENDYLEKRIMQIEDEIRSADSLQRENERLRELLGLSEEHTETGTKICAACEDGTLRKLKKLVGENI